MSYSKTSLIDIIRQHALRFGDFTLPVEKKGLITSIADSDPSPRRYSADFCWLAGKIGKRYSASMPDCVGGMAIGGPDYRRVVMLAGQQGLPTRGFMVRKEAKQHGMGRLVEGPVSPGMKCVIVEDVTSGGSAIQAVEAVKAFGLEVLGVMAVVDRLEGDAALSKQPVLS